MADVDKTSAAAHYKRELAALDAPMIAMTPERIGFLAACERRMAAEIPGTPPHDIVRAMLAEARGERAS